MLALVTVDDAEVLEGRVFGLLDSLRGQECDAVVVHRGTAPDSRRRLANHEAVLEVLQSDPVGPSKARNLALRWAQNRCPPNTVVSFPDDDCSYPPGLVTRALKCLESVDFVCGVYSPRPPHLEPGRFPEGTVRLTRVPFSVPVSAAAMFCRLAPLAYIGGFHESVGPATVWDSGEEHDLAVRLIRSGCLGLYEPSLVVTHDYVDRRAQERRTAWIGLNTSYVRLDPRFAPVAGRAWARLASDVIRGRLSLHQAGVIAAASLDRKTSRAVREAYRTAATPHE